MKIGFLYGGQGSQVEGMGKDLYEAYPYIKEFYDNLDMGFDLKELSFDGSIEEISQTVYTQGILLAHQIAVTDILREHGIKPSVTLGLSLGEYGALYGAGVIDKDQAMDIIKYRSNQMAEVEKTIESGMAAVMTDDEQKIKEILESISTQEGLAEISGINTRRQIVISGEKSSIDKAIEQLTEEKIRTIPLNTSGPFHTSYMNPVKEKLEEYFEDVEFKESMVPVYSNYTGKIEEENYKDLLANQVSHTVRLKESLEDLLTKDLDYIVEIGYGETMRGFVRRLDRKVEVIPLSDRESIETFVSRIKGDNYQ